MIYMLTYLIILSILKNNYSYVCHLIILLKAEIKFTQSADKWDLNSTIGNQLNITIVYSQYTILLSMKLPSKIKKTSHKLLYGIIYVT